MGHQQPPTPVSTENTLANSIFNRTAKQKGSSAIDMRFYWVRYRIRQNHLHIFWKESKKNLAGCVTKHRPIWHHITMRPRYAKATKKDIENSKDWKTGTGRGCAGTNNIRRTRKPENPLKGIRNKIPRNLYNSLKGVQDLAPNGTRSQWPRGLTVQT